jgi:hypothetical protein
MMVNTDLLLVNASVLRHTKWHDTLAGEGNQFFSSSFDGAENDMQNFKDQEAEVMESEFRCNQHWRGLKVSTITFFMLTTVG